MKNSAGTIIFVVIIVIGALVRSGVIGGPSKDDMIQEIIKGANSARSQIIAQSQGAFQDVKIYRDGEKHGVVYEYVFAKDVDVDRSLLTNESVKAECIANFKQSPDWKNMKMVFNEDIYFIFKYVGDDGEVYAMVNISKKDI